MKSYLPGSDVPSDRTPRRLFANLQEFFGGVSYISANRVSEIWKVDCKGSVVVWIEVRPCHKGWILDLLCSADKSRKVSYGLYCIHVITMAVVIFPSPRFAPRDYICHIWVE